MLSRDEIENHLDAVTPGILAVLLSLPFEDQMEVLGALQELLMKWVLDGIR